MVCRSRETSVDFDLLTGHGVLLNQALINHGLAFLMEKSYTPVQPPFFMHKEVMAKTAQLEEFDEALYKVGKSTATEWRKLTLWVACFAWAAWAAWAARAA